MLDVREIDVRLQKHKDNLIIFNKGSLYHTQFNLDLKTVSRHWIKLDQ